jgi:hypothetical protein
MIYLLTAVGLSPGGSITVHIYTQKWSLEVNYVVNKCPSLARAMVDAFSRRSLIAEALFRSYINPYKIRSILVWPLLIVGVEGLLLHLITHNDTQVRALELLWTWCLPVSETSTRQHTIFKKGRHLPPPPAGFEPSVPESERPPTHTLDRAAPYNICDGHSGTGSPFSPSACFPLSVSVCQCSVLMYYCCCKTL